MSQKVIISKHLDEELTTALSKGNYDHVFVLMDDTTEGICHPLISKFRILKNAIPITIGTSDTHKNLESLTHVWTTLDDNQATRHSCLVNLGGGMITDLGGFAASTFKRGMDFINVPTTLLAMVDAAVGGKTGINFNGLKNEIGVFNDAKRVIIDTDFLRTLDQQNILSGAAEMLKTALVDDERLWGEMLNNPPFGGQTGVNDVFVQRCVEIKQRIVEQDHAERGMRKALNFGHTIGHALEEWAARNGKPILHGYAVAYGMVCELYLSVIKCGFPTDRMRQTVNFIKANYGQITITCKDYDDLVEFMTHDKKNSRGAINFTLLGDIGYIKIDNAVTVDEIKESLDFYREG